MKTKKNILAIAIALTVLLAFSVLLIQVNAADSSLVVSAKLPFKLTFSAAIWDGSNAYVFGGGNEEGPKNTILKYNPASNQVSVASATLPDSITDAGAIYDGRYAYLFSGWTDRTGGNSGKIVRYDPVSDSVKVMKATVPTWSMSAVWDGRYAYLFGGSSYNNQILRYDPVRDEITTMNAKFPFGIKWTSAVWTGSYAYIFGGNKDWDTAIDQIFMYDPVADSVTTLTTKLPEKLYVTSAVWTGTYALIFGGTYKGGSGTAIRYDTIIKFDPAQGSTTVTDQTLPTPRRGTSAVWDGSNAFIFGGDNQVSTGEICFDDIIKYTPAQQLSPAQSELLSLPAYPYSHHQPYALRTESYAGAQLLSVSQQTVNVSSGQSVSFNITYRVYSASNLGAIMQLFFAESWAPSWPPNGYTIPVYNGQPGSGVTETKTITFNAPTTGGTYYLWFCWDSQYNMQDAVNYFSASMNGLPAHVKVVVAGQTTTPTQTLGNQSIDTWLLLGVVGFGIVAVALAFAVVHYRKRASSPKEAHVSPMKATSKEQQICPNCGAILPVGSKFCGKCGTALQ